LRRTKQIGKAIVALMLLTAFFSPIIAQFAHIFKKHEHVVCNGKDTHFHQKTPDCAICHFHFAPFEYQVTESYHLLPPTISTNVEKHFTSLSLRSFQKTNTQLRAPPAFS